MIKFSTGARTIWHLMFGHPFRQDCEWWDLRDLKLNGALSWRCSCKLIIFVTGRAGIGEAK